jgi:hypothetical protein
VFEEYFAKKREQLGLDRGDVLQVVQDWLETQYPGQVRAKSLHRGTLRIVTVSSAVASELRMRQMELLAATRVDGETRVAISIGALS